jgi:hypothetical protein
MASDTFRHAASVSIAEAGKRVTLLVYEKRMTRSVSAGNPQVRKEKPQVQDERALSIDMEAGAANLWR